MALIAKADRTLERGLKEGDVVPSGLVKSLKALVA